jgi:hypothetical protein
VAEQIEGQDPVAALGQRTGERLVHTLAEQEAVEQHNRSVALAI